MNIPCPKWISIKDFKNLSDEEINNWTFPLMAKSNKGGYDGKGNRKIKTTEDLDSFLTCLLYTSPSPRDMRRSRMPSSA